MDEINVSVYHQNEHGTGDKLITGAIHYGERLKCCHDK